MSYSRGENRRRMDWAILNEEIEFLGRSVSCYRVAFTYGTSRMANVDGKTCLKLKNHNLIALQSICS